MPTCTELYIDTLGGLDLDGSSDKNFPYFVVENLATLIVVITQHCIYTNLQLVPQYCATALCWLRLTTSNKRT